MWKFYKCLRHLRVKFRDACNLNQQTTATNEDLNRHQPSACCLDRFHFWQHEDDSKYEKSNKNTSRKHSNLDVDNNYCSFFEAVGWGAAFVVGLQYASRKWNTRDLYENRDVKFRDFFYRLSTSPSIASWRLNPIKLNVLPVSSQPSTTDLPLNFDFDTESNIETQKFQIGDENENLQNGVDDEETEKSEKSQFYSKFSAELSSVADDFVSLIQNNVGIDLIRGKKHNDALFHFENACELGNPKACFNAGVCYETGIGTEINILKAKEFYEKAAEKGHATAMYNLGVLNLRNLNNSEDEFSKSIELLESAASLGIKEAQKFMAVFYLENNEMEKAIPFLTAAIEKNDVECQYYLGLCYENGWGLEENLSKASEFYGKAAESGHLDAMFNFAMFHEFGLGGVDKQPEVAFEMYSKAAREGHVESQERLNKMALEREKDVEHETSTLIRDSEIHNSLSLPNITSLNRKSLTLTKCLSENILRMQKKITLHFQNHENNSLENSRNVFDTNEDFVTHLWTQPNVVM